MLHGPTLELISVPNPVMISVVHKREHVVQRSSVDKKKLWSYIYIISSEKKISYSGQVLNPGVLLKTIIKNSSKIKNKRDKRVEKMDFSD